jgi:hypothetical protein
MIFPNNTLTILLKSHPNEFFIQFNTFDALKRVNATTAPVVQVRGGKKPDFSSKNF